jgi:WD40 repeat protein
VQLLREERHLPPRGGEVRVPAYDAFISYSHAKDKPIAAALQSVIQKLGKAWYERRAARVFRDDTSLSATPHLWPSIEKALSESRHLILLASPEAASSPWIAKEVDYWLRHKSPDTLYIGLTSGELAWDNKKGDFKWTAATPLPKVLKGKFASEPKWVDLSAYRDGADPRNAKLIDLGADFAAAIRGVPKEDLMSEEVRQQRRARRLAVGVSGFVLGLAGLAVWQWQTAESERLENLRKESDLAAVTSQQLAAEGKAALAQVLALEGLPRQDPMERPLNEVTLSALQRAVRADRSLATLTVPRRENVMTCAFTPDGAHLLSGINGGTLIVWDMATLKLKRQIATKNLNITEIDISPDGKLALITGGDYPGIWEIESGKLVWQLDKTEKGYARTGRFSPDGKLFALGYRKNVAEIREAANGRLLHELRGPEDFEAAYKRRTSNVWSGSDDPIVMAVEHATWQIFGGMSEVLFSPDGKLLATAGSGDAEGAVRLFDTATGDLSATLRGETLTNNYGIQRFAFSPDGSLLAVSGRDHKIAIWNVSTRTVKATLARTIDASALTFSHSGEFIAAGYDDGSIWVWKTDGGQPVAAPAAHDEAVQSIAFGPNDDLLATSSSDRSVGLWNSDLRPCTLQTGSDCSRVAVPIARFREHTDTVQFVAFNPAGTVLASTSRDGSIRLWRTIDSGLTRLVRRPGADAADQEDRASREFPSLAPDPWAYLQFSGDGQQLLSYSPGRYGDGFVLWDLTQSKELCWRGGERIAGGRSGPFMLHQTPLDVEPFACPASQEDEDGTFSPLSDYAWMVNVDGTRAIGVKEWLGARDDGSFIPLDDAAPKVLYDVANKRAVVSLEVNGRAAKNLQFSQDGSVVVAALPDPTNASSNEFREYAVWDAATGKLLKGPWVLPLAADLLAVGDRGRALVFAKSSWARILYCRLDATDQSACRDIEGPRLWLTAIAVSADGERVAAAYKDGSVRVFSVDYQATMAILQSGNNGQRELTFSPDKAFLAGIDEKETVWLWDIATQSVISRVAPKSSVEAVKFAPTNDRLGIITHDAEAYVLAVHTDWLGLASPRDLIDWTRASVAATLSASERQRYLLKPNDSEIGGVDFSSLKAGLPTARRPEGATSAVLAECDRLSANPTDRGRRAEGIIFERLDVPRALQACTTALATAPNDALTVYQHGRILERAGRLPEALKHYERAAASGHAAATRRIGQLIQLNLVGEDAGLGPYETWVDRAALRGDGYAQANKALRLGLAAKAPRDLIDALRYSLAAQAGNPVTAVLQLGLDIEQDGTSLADREKSFFLYQLGLRLAAYDDPDTISEDLRQQAADRVKNLSTLLDGATVVRLYREARDFRP